MKYKGYRINLRPIRENNSTDISTGVWMLELEKDGFITGRAVGVEMTLQDIQEYALDEIDKLIEKEKKQ
jgi:hypothetical protein